MCSDKPGLARMPLGWDVGEEAEKKRGVVVGASLEEAGIVTES